MTTPSPRRSNAVQATFLVGCCALVAMLTSPVLVCAQPADVQFTPAAPGEMKPMAVVAHAGYDALVEDLNFAGSLAGNPDLSQMIEPFLMTYTQGLDRTKPLGVIVQSDGMNFGGAACLPVSDLKKLLAPLQMFGLTTEDVGGGITKLVTPQQPAFIREADGWAFVSPMQEMLSALPANPTETLSTLSKEYDLAAQVNIQNIPQAYRQMAMQQLDMGMQAGLKKLPDESDDQFAVRQEMTQLQIDQFKQLINDMNQMTVGLSLDGSGQRAFLDFAYTAVPESKLAGQLAMYEDAKTNFAGFYQPDAAMMMSVATKMNEADIAQVEQMFGALRKQAKAAIAKDADLPTPEARAQVEAAVDEFLDALQATLKTGTIDGGAVLNIAPDSLTFVAGAFVAEPAKIESGFKKLIEVAKQKDGDALTVNWNSASHADVNFHTFSAPLEGADEEAKKLLGDTVEVALGIGKESVYFAVGRNCVESIKSIVDASAAEPGKSVPPMEMSFALKPILEVAAATAPDSQQPIFQSIAAMLANEASGRDHVRIVMQTIPNGVRSRFEAEEGVLRAIGMAAMQAQMQAAGVGAPMPAPQ